MNAVHSDSPNENRQPTGADRLHLGTSSWTFSQWQGVFYPQQLANAQQLTYYASHFNTVEVNTSFYALPQPATLINWVQSVPPGFAFALKAPRAITHEKRLVDCQTDALSYLDAVRSLGAAAAPGFLQLPPNFTRQQAGRTLAHFIDWLVEQLDGVRLAVEVRAADLMTAAFARFVAERGLSLVLVDREGSADLFPAWMDLVESGAAPDFCLIRWIGDQQDPAINNRDLVHLRDEALAEWAQRVRRLLDAGIAVYGYMHNPYEGHSPESVRRLQAHLAEQGIAPPNWPPAGWSAPGGEDDPPGQLSLFDGEG